VEQREEIAMLRRNLKAAYTIWYRDVLRFVRDRTRIVGALAQPLLYLFVFGTGLASAVSSTAGTALNFKQFIFPGIVANVVLFTAIFSAISIVWDREFGFLKEVMVAPVSRTAVALGKVAGGATVATCQGTIVLLLAPLIGIRISWDQVVVLIGLMLLMGTVMTALGTMIAARQRSMEGFQMMMNFLLVPMLFVSGALFPVRGVPGWLAWLSTIDPVTYGVDALRGAALRQKVPADILQLLTLHSVSTDIAVMAILAVAFVVPAVWQFGRTE
jgi:ABC-2 type transport system permease protein